MTDTTDLFKLDKKTFIEQVVLLLIKGQIKLWGDVIDVVKDYSSEHSLDFEEMYELLESEMIRKHFFED